MPFRRHLLAALILLAATSAQAKKPHHRPDGEPGQFDYYAMALSWSPSFCATHDDPKQCASGRQLGFVVHGLWPQYARGYPEECSRERLPDEVRRRYAPLYPAPHLIDHEWKKHGTCSGLDPAAYFAMTARLRDALVVPPAYQKPLAPVRSDAAQFAQAFRAANPRLAADSVLPFCTANGRFLNEIHVCYDKRGESVRCGDSEIKRSANTCRQGAFTLQNVK